MENKANNKDDRNTEKQYQTNKLSKLIKIYVSALKTRYN